MLGEFLYRILERDQAVLEPFVIQRQAVSALPFTSVTITLPTDRWFLFKHMTFAVIPTAGIIATALTITATDPRFAQPPALLNRAFGNPAPAAGVAVRETISTEFAWFVPASTILASASYSGAGATNTLDIGLFGFSIPRGNLTLAQY